MAKRRRRKADCRSAPRCNRLGSSKQVQAAGRSVCETDLSGGRRCPLALVPHRRGQRPRARKLRRLPPDPPPPVRAAETADVEFSADAGHLRQRGRRRHRHGRGPDGRATAIILPPTRSSGTARPARSAPRAMSSSSIPQGDKLIGDNVVLTDTLRDGTIDNLLVVLESGGRIAADAGTRSAASTILENAVYSPCPVTTETGCPRTRAGRSPPPGSIHDPADAAHPLRAAAGCSFFGVTLPLLPIFSVGTGGDGRRHRRVLVPDISLSEQQRASKLPLPYYWQIAPNRDLTITPHVYTEASCRRWRRAIAS